MTEQINPKIKRIREVQAEYEALRGDYNLKTDMDAFLLDQAMRITIKAANERDLRTMNKAYKETEKRWKARAKKVDPTSEMVSVCCMLAASGVFMGIVSIGTGWLLWH